MTAYCVLSRCARKRQLILGFACQVNFVTRLNGVPVWAVALRQSCKCFKCMEGAAQHADPSERHSMLLYCETASAVHPKTPRLFHDDMYKTPKQGQANPAASAITAADIIAADLPYFGNSAAEKYNVVPQLFSVRGVSAWRINEDE